MVAAHCPAYAVGVGFFRPVSTDYVEICGMFALWDSRDRDEKHGVGPGDKVIALSQSVDFSGIGCSPEIAVGTVAEFLVFGKFAGVRVESVTVECHEVDTRVMRVGVGCMKGP